MTVMIVFWPSLAHGRSSYRNSPPQLTSTKITPVRSTMSTAKAGHEPPQSSSNSSSNRSGEWHKLNFRTLATKQYSRSSSMLLRCHKWWRKRKVWSVPEMGWSTYCRCMKPEQVIAKWRNVFLEHIMTRFLPQYIPRISHWKAAKAPMVQPRYQLFESTSPRECTLFLFRVK